MKPGAANKVKSFFKSMGFKSIATSMGFQKALSEEINGDVDYKQKYDNVIEKNDVQPILHNSISASGFKIPEYDYSDPADTQSLNTAPSDAKAQAFAERKGVEPEGEKMGKEKSYSQPGL